jgi:cytochrome b
MTTTEKTSSPARRKPKAIEFTILYGWHAVISGAFIVAYFSGDEDTYAMHQFAGYLVLAALGIRLIAALLAPQGSPLRIRRPTPAPLTAWLAALVAGNGARGTGPASLPRRPLLTLMATTLLISIVATAASGAAADFLPFIEHLHELLGELALWIVLGHVTSVVLLNALPKLWHRSSGGRLSPAGERC